MKPPRWAPDVADRLETGAGLIDLALRAGMVDVPTYRHKLEAIVVTLTRLAVEVRAGQVASPGALIAPLDLARRAVLVCLRFRCTRDADTRTDLGEVADELATLIEEALCREGAMPRVAQLARRIALRLKAGS